MCNPPLRLSKKSLALDGVVFDAHYFPDAVEQPELGIGRDSPDSYPYPSERTLMQLGLPSIICLLRYEPTGWSRRLSPLLLADPASPLCLQFTPVCCGALAGSKAACQRGGFAQEYSHD